VEMTGCASPAASASVSTAAAAGCSSWHNHPAAAAVGADDDMQRCDSGAANNGAAGGCSSKQQQQQQQQQQQLLQPLPVGQPLSGGDYEVDVTDLFDLMCWYWSAVEAAWQCMEHFSTQVCGQGLWGGGGRGWLRGGAGRGIVSCQLVLCCAWCAGTGLQWRLHDNA
jgi:hypothetical protein